MYKWSTAGARGQLSDSKGDKGDSFETTDSSVLYSPYAGQRGADTVTVEAVIITGAEKTELDAATATVTVTTPASTTAQAGTLIFTRNNADGSVTIFGFYTFPQQSGAIGYAIGGNAIQAVGSYLTAADLQNPAPVISQAASSTQGFTAAMAYTVSFNNQGFFNLGGGLVGYYVYTGGFPPGSEPPGLVPGLEQSLRTFFKTNPATVRTDY
jgi:hypothetical protein